MSAAVKIGDLAQRLNIPTETIRYYEREGLLPPPQRTGGNYRLYDSTLVERLAFIRNCRAFDLTLEEIRELLKLRDAPDLGCGAVNDLLDEHIVHVTERMSQLRRLRSNLQTLRDRCSKATDTRHCAILDGLSHDPEAGGETRSHIPLHAKR